MSKNIDLKLFKINNLMQKQKYHVAMIIKNQAMKCDDNKRLPDDFVTIFRTIDVHCHSRLAMTGQGDFLEFSLE